MPIFNRTLDEHKQDFKNRKFLAMPLAGLFAWLVVGIAGLMLPTTVMVWVLFGMTGSIVYLGMAISKWTGEDFKDRTRPKNALDQLFFLTVGQALLVYALAIPFFLVDPTSLPLSVGILTGLMWLPLTWMIDHWVGAFHAVARTLVVLVLWYAFPEHRFVAIPFAIVLLYGVTIYVLHNRKIESGNRPAPQPTH
ncbi:hypothetical protein SAMN05421823_113116 [Catalinimonas alkaloidigena]|uniref:Uncharacterized protein n=1 Tax=Catalinimonas alkaloidigena TaxID=1075417 RepID=A0A1G9T814_9BACT|nr:hypothetical protein [Catalinimonas alkaloidigena]SDM43787.1 hypothetical protein SAMN05421823_113116 [Catalinimonas alkaloidigena]